MKVTTIGMDLGKRVFHLVAHDAVGHECWRRKVSRARLLTTLVQLPACTVVMESCSGAQYWAREVTKLGHTPRLLAPQHTRAYVRATRMTSTTPRRSLRPPAVLAPVWYR